MRPGWRFINRYDVLSDADLLIIAHTDHQGRRFAVAPFELRRVEMGVLYDEATLGGRRTDGDDVADVTGFLQAALDLAWERGLRPEGHFDTANELKAVRYHLEDMRILAKLPAART